ncbi:hypothetical protein NW069_03385 [Mycoplasmopsis cynos]|uniref:hypothetical protein n=1 Tax=Mycoplasmopsis cynos TaxID=171284 RepID=UPI002203E65E|nr:hypothetical protein [Mycoplasmopsis cynos]UWV80360.1 hypothetical protein NW069_03385 [Mycoplasmopsis cynos]
MFSFEEFLYLGLFKKSSAFFLCSGDRTKFFSFFNSWINFSYSEKFLLSLVFQIVQIAVALETKKARIEKPKKFFFVFFYSYN